MRFLRVTVAVLVVCGMVGLALTALFGFEEPNTILLLLSAGLLFGAALTVFAHAGLTRVLTPAQRRIWLHQFTGRRAPWAFGEYLNSDDPAAAAIRFTEDVVDRDRVNQGSPPGGTP
jgi:hypothetical protein